GDGCDETCQVECPCTCQGVPSTCVCPTIKPVAGTKLVVIDKLVTAGRAKVSFLARDAAITKGTGTDAGAIQAAFTAAYGTSGSATGSFFVPRGDTGWVANDPDAAKFVNRSPAGTTDVTFAVADSGKVLKLIGRSLGDVPFDIRTGGQPNGVYTTFCITNGS